MESERPLLHKLTPDETSLLAKLKGNIKLFETYHDFGTGMWQILSGIASENLVFHSTTKGSSVILPKMQYDY